MVCFDEVLPEQIAKIPIIGWLVSRRLWSMRHGYLNTYNSGVCSPL